MDTTTVMIKTKFLLDSGDPDEYKTIADLAKQHGYELWGSTTNPSLIAKKLGGKKITQDEALQLQKDIVLEILKIVPGAVSAEVYAEADTPASAMVEQGRDIATWDERIYVKLPTTIEGFRARTALRKEGIPVNNTLVFSQEQIFAICLHEDIIQKEFNPKPSTWPMFISPFVGRLDDIGIDGMQLISDGLKIKERFATPLWMLEASVRRMEHMRRGFASETEIVTAPAKMYIELFTAENNDAESISDTAYAKDLSSLPLWENTDGLKAIETIDGFMEALDSKRLNIQHDLTDKGIERFTADWKAIIAS